jgi:hypothetical protein
MTIRTDVDQLIDWYVEHTSSTRVVPVIASPRTIGKFARKRRRGPYMYREFEIVPIRRAKVRRQEPDNKQTELQT